MLCGKLNFLGSARIGFIALVHISIESAKASNRLEEKDVIG